MPKISEYVEKTLPAADDLLPIVDSAASPVKTKRIKWSNLRAGRTASYVIAAYDAPLSVKTQADYTLISATDDLGYRVNAAIAGGYRHVGWSEGNLSVSTPIVPVDNLHLRGAGRYTSKLKLADGANVDVIASPSAQVTGADFSDFTIDGNGANNTSGSGFNIASAQCTFRNLYVVSCKENGLLFAGFGAGVGGDILHNVRVISNLGIGINIQALHSDMYLSQCDVGLNAVYAGIYTASGGLHIQGCEIYNQGQHGIVIGGGAVDARIFNSFIDVNGYNGIYITGDDEDKAIIIVGNHFRYNSALADNTYSHIALDDNVGNYHLGHSIIANNRFRASGGTGAKYCVNLQTSNASYWHIHDNDMIDGYVTAPINVTGTNHKIHHNSGADSFSTSGYYEINAASAGNVFLVAAGGEGWVDTDISGSAVPANAKAVAIQIENAGGDNCGVRLHGSPQARPIYVAGTHITSLAQVDSTRHLDFYRTGTNHTYAILGYWLE